MRLLEVLGEAHPHIPLGGTTRGPIRRAKSPVSWGFVLQAKVHSANLLDQEGIKALLARADERFPASGEALVYAAMIRLMARRLACV